MVVSLRCFLVDDYLLPEDGECEVVDDYLLPEEGECEVFPS